MPSSRTWSCLIGDDRAVKARQSEKWLREHLGHLQPSVVKGSLMVRVEEEGSGLLRGVLLETSAYTADRFDLEAWVQPLATSTEGIHLTFGERWASVDLEDERSVEAAVAGAQAAWDRVGAFRDALALARHARRRAHGASGQKTAGEAYFGAGDVRRARSAWSRALGYGDGTSAFAEHVHRLLDVTKGLDGAAAQRMAAGWARALIENGRIPDGTVDLAYFDRPRTRGWLRR